jgi:anti-sigma regulatory factor (Ser/Thr protein kinase)
MGIQASGPRTGVARAAGSGAGTGRVMFARPRTRLPVPPPFSRDTAMARGWPLASFLELGAFPGAIPCARAHAKAVLWEWGSALLDPAELVVSELATNAVQASAVLVKPAVLRLWVVSDGRGVLVMVWDASPRIPACRGESFDIAAEGGRGLLLVETLSARWSWYASQDWGGKIVWALITDMGGV